MAQVTRISKRFGWSSKTLEKEKRNRFWREHESLTLRAWWTRPWKRAHWERVIHNEGRARNMVMGIQSYIYINKIRWDLGGQMSYIYRLVHTSPRSSTNSAQFREGETVRVQLIPH